MVLKIVVRCRLGVLQCNGANGVKQYLAWHRDNLNLWSERFSQAQKHLRIDQNQ